EIFRHDTGWHVATENRELNRPLVVAAGERVDAIISAQREEIAHLSSHAAALLAEAAQHASAAGATKFARIEALAAERVDLRQRLDELTRQFACLNQDISAEHHGQARCDGLEARAGVGSRYNFAVDMAKFVQTERSAAAARLAEIDAHLALLDDPDDQADISLSTQGLLDRITAQRARMLVELERLTADRDAAVQAAALADPDFAPLPDGLIARGEALETLAKTSNWLAMRIWLVFLTIVVLDISAILVMSLMPAPQTVVLGEALTAEIAIRQALARAEQATSEAMASMFDARIRAAEAENVADERVSSLRAAIETRRMLNKQVNAELGRRFRKAA
ncbi:DUF4407 domain-containing protein, partial [Neomegalonema sp.]|uniref:DUF4407 domain-containing protein n=1 Tax=Neomegalonema sp. TaxID=2039713 RepID=UPI002611F8FE